MTSSVNNTLEFRIIQLSELAIAQNLPSLFLVDVVVVQNEKLSYEDSVLVEDESIKDDLSTNYTVKFDSGVFKVPENGKALIFVKPNY